MDIVEFGKKRKKRRLKQSALLGLIAVLLLAIIIILILLIGGSEGKLRAASMSNTGSYDAVIIRKEKLITAFEADGGFDVADRFLKEGSAVSAGDRVMDVYRLGYKREITLSLWRTKQEIYKEQLAVMGEARNEQLRMLDDGVENAKQALAKAVMNDDAAALELENELSRLLDEREQYLKSETHRTEKLLSLYQNEEGWASTEQESKLSLEAPNDGIVSFHFDDHTMSLNADKLDIMTSNLIASALKNDKMARWSGSIEAAAYRIVEPQVWYCAFLTDADEALRTVAGCEYQIEIEGYGKFKGVAENYSISDKKIINILRMSEPMGALINARSVKLKVQYSAQGLRAEKRAVQFENGRAYMEFVDGGKRSAVYVEVLAQDGNRVIIKAQNSEDTIIKEGARYWIPKQLNTSLKKLLKR